MLNVPGSSVHRSNGHGDMFVEITLMVINLMAIKLMEIKFMEMFTADSVIILENIDPANLLNTQSRFPQANCL